MKMCLFNFLKLELKQEDEKTVDLFQKATGINCTVFYFDDNQTITSIFESLGNNDYSTCPSVKALETVSFDNILRIFDLDGKPYVFFGHCMYAFIAVAALSRNGHRNIFIAGPICTENYSPKEPFPCLHSDVSSLSVLSSSRIKIASQLLYDLVKFSIPVDHLDPSIKNEQSNALLDSVATIHAMDNSVFYEILNANLIARNKKQVVKSLNYMSDHIERILKLVATNQIFLAKQVSEELIFPIVLEEDLIQARSLFVGIASLLGQKVAESYDFLYTREMFIAYSEYIENMSNANDKSSIYSLTVIYFNNIFNEMLNSYRCNKVDSPASKTINYIQKNYKADININSIAHILNFDSSYLCRAFKDEMGVTIKSYIINYRLCRAADLILTSNKSISTISEYVGYQDVKLFVKHFKSQYGTTPSTYRQALNG